jgi:hypothetical protein
MKGFWSYLGPSFEESRKPLKKNPQSHHHPGLYRPGKSFF